MTHRPVLAAFLVALATLAGSGTAAADTEGNGGNNLVFVQTNQPDGNQVVVFHRGRDGRLTRSGSFSTGGLGGTAAPGTESDRLASQGSLAYDRGHKLLIAVNAGSDTVSAFSLHGDRLRLESVLPSGGQFPASVAVHDDLAYVLNSGGTGTVQGFHVDNHGLEPIAGSVRSLGLANSDPPNFLTAPGQVGFTPDGGQLIVTTKASGSTIDVFEVERDGTLSGTAVANPSATPVPFAFTFDPSGRVVSGEAGASSVTTYRLQSNGTLTDPRSEPDGQAALCWVLRVGDFYYVSNTASNTLSSYRIGSDGSPILVSAVAATTNPGPIDLASSDGFLYAETGSTGTVDEFAIGSDGTLSTIGTVTGLPPGIEGIVAT